MLDALRNRGSQLVDDLATLVEIESPSGDVDATRKAADAVAAIGVRLVGAAPEVLDTDGGRPFLRWAFGQPPWRVVLVGHLDTVWPIGTLARWPFHIDHGMATGPGAFDMKAGLVQGLHALSLLDDLDGIAFVVNADEETGSLGSRALIEESARGASAALVLEPSAAGALKTGRKGVSLYDLDVTGLAAHAGLEPEKGVNATVELAAQILAVGSIADAAVGTTVTPTTAAAGTTINTVPASATVHFDVRCASIAEQERVDRALRALETTLPGSGLRLRGGPNRPPFEESSSRTLFALANEVAAELGLRPLDGVVVGGGSDGNFTAGIGVPTLDGLGAVGDNAHAEGEHVIIDAMPERAALVGGLVERLLRS